MAGKQDATWVLHIVFKESPIEVSPDANIHAQGRFVKDGEWAMRGKP